MNLQIALRGLSNLIFLNVTFLIHLLLSFGGTDPVIKIMNKDIWSMCSIKYLYSFQHHT